MNRWLTVLALGLALAVPAAWAQSRPPADAKPLSAIVLALEQQGFGPIVEIEFDDGQWEVEAFKDGRKRKLKIDPVSGRITADRPDD